MRGLITILLAAYLASAAVCGFAGEAKNAVEAAPAVTFVELGSSKCVPCKMMKPVMKKIEDRYAGRVQVVFYDIWTAAGKPYAKQYNVRMIPTQVFLDAEGKEFYRHEGFLAAEAIEKLLKNRGVD